MASDVERIAGVLAAWWQTWDGPAYPTGPEIAAAFLADDGPLAPLLTAARADGWDEAVRAVAWCMDNGEQSAAAALAYVASKNPHRAVVNAARAASTEAGTP